MDHIQEYIMHIHNFCMTNTKTNGRRMTIIILNPLFFWWHVPTTNAVGVMPIYSVLLQDPSFNKF